jgi:hypothetical protein
MEIGTDAGQTRSGYHNDAPIKLLEGAGAIISLALCVMYFAVAPLYQRSWPMGVSVPGVNIYEFFGAAYVMICGSFVLLLVINYLPRTVFTFLAKVFFLSFSAWQMVRVLFLWFEHETGWLGREMPLVAYISYCGLLLIPIILLLAVTYVFIWMRARRGEPLR